MKEELRNRAFVPQWLLGTRHDPTYEDNEASRKADESAPVEHPERHGLTLVTSSGKKLRAA